MGVPPSEARALTFYEYTAMLAIWNDRHADPKGGAPVAPPDVTRVRADLDLIAANPAMLN